LPLLAAVCPSLQLDGVQLQQIAICLWQESGHRVLPGGWVQTKCLNPNPPDGCVQQEAPCPQTPEPSMSATRAYWWTTSRWL
jgi:hypothetical protein